MRLFIISMLMGVAATIHAATPSNEEVVFLDNPSLESVFLQAQQTGMWVLVDCYTSWCGPCKQMMREVFTRKDVGKFVNANFISVKIDMEKGEGPAIGKKYAVKGYPTFLFFSPDGQLRHQALGGREPTEFILLCERAKKGYVLDDLRAQYATGNRDKDFLFNYIYELYDYNQRDESAAIALQLLNGKEEQLYTDSKYYRLFLNFDRNFFSSRWEYVIKNRQVFEQRYDSLELAKKIEQLVTSTPGQYFQYDEEQGVYHVDEEGINKFVQTMKSYGIPDWHQREMNPRLLAAEYQHQWDKYVSIYDSYIREGFENDGYIIMCIKRVFNLTNNHSHKVMKRWIKLRTKVLKKQRDIQWTDEYRMLNNLF